MECRRCNVEMTLLSPNKWDCPICQGRCTVTTHEQYEAQSINWLDQRLAQSRNDPKLHYLIEHWEK